jgi:hypothetical protein
MKKLIFIIILAAFSVSLSSQGLFKPVPSNLFPKDLSGSKVLKNEFKFIPRINVGVMGTSYGKNAEGVLEVTPLSALGFGLGLLRYRDVEGVPFNDIGINLMYLQNTQTPGSGVGIYGTYNTGQVGLFNLGTHYDFGVDRLFVDVGLSFHY